MAELIIRECCLTSISLPHKEECLVGIQKQIETNRWVEGYIEVPRRLRANAQQNRLANNGRR